MLGVNYPDVNQYLSLIHESDKALEYLISYFEQVDEPVEIVFFGDHQPSLSSSFYPYLNGKGLSGLTLDELEDLYTIPFFIWTNYESESEPGGDYEYQLPFYYGVRAGGHRAAGIQPVFGGYAGSHTGNQLQRILFTEQR